MVARRLVVLVAALVMLGALAGACSPDDGDPPADGGSAPTTAVSAPASVPATSEPPLGAPTPTFEALSDAFTYGDDPALDQLWDACAAGSGKACDDLYFAAPTDSDYEMFGYTCGNRPDVILCPELDELLTEAPTTR